MTKAVIGLGFGDEGKGITTDYLCSKISNSLVVRFSGGHQAGHTVVLDNSRHVFSNFGSGTLRGIPTYWSQYCTVEPTGLVNELQLLESKGVKPVLFIDERCPVTTPYDVIANQQGEEVNHHGSCGVGVGATIEREENHYSLLFSDIFLPSILAMKLDLIKKYYKNNRYHSSRNLDNFLESINTIREYEGIRISSGLPHSFYTNLIFEGSQGLLLDQNIGFFPHVTRANTGSKNIIEMGFEPEFYLVTRAYQTRHGAGPMTNNTIPEKITRNPWETNSTNKYQGVFRYSILDLDLLQYGINRDKYIKKGKKSLVITCLDQIKDEYKFTYRGKLIVLSSEEEFLENISGILRIEDIYVSHSMETTNIEKWR